MTSPTPSEPRTGLKLYHAEALTPRRAWLVVIASTLTIFAVQIVLVSAGVPDVGASVASDVLVIAGLLGLLWRDDPRKLLGVRWPRGRFVVAGVLVGIAAWYINLLVVVLLQPPGDVKGLEKIVEQTPLVPTLLAIALLPAIAEELVFRGALARALATRRSGAVAIVLSAAVFAAYHMMPLQMVPTFLLGLALAFISLRANSIIPAMIAHLLNNSVAIVLSRNEVPALSMWIDAHPIIVLALALASVGTGITLAARGVS